jgi:hypothetical protein
MAYGITNRAGYSNITPAHLWHFFDEYQFTKRTLLGYWDERCPVGTNNPELVASVYKGTDDWVIAVGNWSDKAQTGTLQVNWKALGINPEQAVLIVPEISEFQQPAQLKPNDKLDVEGGKGMILILKRK